MSFLPDPLAGETLALLASLALKATVLLLAAALAAAALHRASAATRHLVWSTAMVAVLCLPLFSVLVPALEVPLPLAWTERATWAAAPTHGESPTELPVGFAAPGDFTGISTAEPLAPPRDTGAAPAPLRPERVVAVIMVLGAVTGLLWLLLAFAAAALVGRRAEVIREEGWLRAVQDAADRLGLRRPVLLLRSRDSTMPATWGVLWPSVVVPDSADGWPDDRRRTVLAHELAHVKRFDCATQALALVACVLLWWHPGVWYAARRMRVERERACDDLVLASGARPSEYAAHLLDIARSHRSPRLGSAAMVSMARPSQLESRLLSILDDGRARRAPTPGLTLLVVAGALALAAPLSGLRAARAAVVDIPGVPAEAGPPVPGRGMDTESPGPQAMERYSSEPLTPEQAFPAAPSVPETQVDAPAPLPSDTPGASPSVDDLIRMRAVGVTPHYAAEMRAAGLGRLTTNDLVSLRVAGVSAAWVREVRQLGFALDLDAVRSGAIHRVSPDFVRGLRAEGVELRGMTDAVSLRIHQVTPEFVREMRSLGFADLSAGSLVEMRIHRVTPEFVREMEELGYRGLTRGQLVQMRIHRVTPAYIRELFDAGLTGLTHDQLVRLRISGVGSDLINAHRRAGGPPQL
jgi:beta-lactamase regulating signal transducer with metallopeptidase domain